MARSASDADSTGNPGETSEPGGSAAPTRRLILGATAGLASLAIAGCGSDGTGMAMPGGQTGGRSGGGGTGVDPDRTGGTGAGSGGGSRSTGGSSGSGSGGSSGGSPGSDASSTGGATDGGASDASGGGADAQFPDDARIEVGRPDGMVDTATMSCDDTDPNDEGPFYLPNAPFRNVLAMKGEPGEWLIVTGRVLNTKCQPLANAVVDVWHSDGSPDGKSVYDNQRGGPMKWRGKVRTDPSGFYMYETVRPGRYNNGGRLRPCHIHYKISADGHSTLTTQFQPKGDPFFDSIALHSLDVPFVKDMGVWKTTIDIVLRPGRMALFQGPPAGKRIIAPTPAGPAGMGRRRLFFLGNRRG